MMTNKQRKLYKKMQYSNESKASKVDELRAKRRKLEKTKDQLSKNQAKK
ncbi:hypothetical protein WICPIJ_008839, partial [Wickerhamomyces pijperi]